MARELTGFRDTMEALNAAFPNQWTLSRIELAKFLGVSVRTVSRRFDFPERVRITKDAVARQLCR